MDKMEQFYARLKKSCEMVSCNMPIQFEELQDTEHSQLKISNDEIGEILICDDLLTHRCSSAPCIMVNWGKSKGSAKEIADKIFKKNHRDCDPVQIEPIENYDTVAKQVIEFIQITSKKSIEFIASYTNIANERAPKFTATADGITLKIWENYKSYGIYAYNEQNEKIGQGTLNNNLNGNIDIYSVPYSIKALRDSDSNITNILISNIEQYGIRLPKWLLDDIAFDLKISRRNNNNESLLMEDVATTYEYRPERWAEYKKTYLPRTYGQAYYIIQNLFFSEHFKEKYQNKKIINILDIGCGNGGATLGALEAILLNLDSRKLKEINVYCVDYNNDALNETEELIDIIYRKKYIESKFPSIRLNFIAKQLRLSSSNNPVDGFTSISNAKQFIDDFSSNKLFDFVLSFKMVNEIILQQEQHSAENCINIYENMVSLMASLLAESGVAILTDITMHRRNNENLTFGTYQSKAIFNFIGGNTNGYKLILPIPCSLLGDRCRIHDNCIKQALIGYINNDGKVDADPILFHCIGRTEFVGCIMPTCQRVKQRFVVRYEQKGNIKLCGITENSNGRIINAFDFQDYGREDNNN